MDSVYYIEDISEHETELPFYARPLVAAGLAICCESLQTLLLKPFFNKYLFEVMLALIPQETNVRTTISFYQSKY